MITATYKCEDILILSWEYTNGIEKIWLHWGWEICDVESSATTSRANIDDTIFVQVSESKGGDTGCKVR